MMLVRNASLRRRLPLSIALSAMALPVFGQSTTQSPQALAAPSLPQDNQVPAMQQPQNLPASPSVTDAQASFVLRDVVFNGASVFSAQQLRAAAADNLGKPVTLADLDRVADRITLMYRQHGYVFATAVVPVQQVKDGVVQLSIIEGRLGQIHLQVLAGAPIGEQRVRAMLAPLVPGQPLNGKTYERTMLLLSDIPGIKAESALSSGAEPGTTDLTVKISQGHPFNVSLGIDDYGTREAGTLRGGGSLRWNSPLGYGDNLDLRALVSEHGGTAFGRLSYEAPIGHEGIRAGVGATQADYSLGGKFEPLDAIGRARIYDGSLTFPLVRQRSQNFFLRLAVDRKELTDELRAVHYQSHKRVQGISAGWAWERRDNLLGGGYFSSNGVLYLGNLRIADPNLRALDQGPYGNHTSGDFAKLTFQFSRLQALSPKQTLFLGIGAQLSNHDLDASEKLSLGGHDTVRAYAQGEVLADQGFIANLEYRYALRKDLTTYAFYDVSRGWLNRSHQSPDGRPIRSLRGPGVGLNWARPGDFAVDFTVAWRDSRAGVTSGGDKKPRVFFQIQKFF
ncbi:ShlB/FhaC/HecB family hemolysin secretion/activation protein [Dyella tabacisoli]|uniref:ShlB/FhaC/HecB family hemolysin secretion/activation protein n=1 Tax=Dyella tabacisoli TaxID=2282381 RepID=A0A369UI02_9GAMM|nr:ShlB/FhaC/HecB family hemolysin secretion/activation protein [Dyella tabacisoli]RDD80201.1 ShlB/FhaC/HecB family hemolysin secretion/activation protein [Dyella tabacisoli]